MNVEAFSSGSGTEFAQKFLSCHRSMIAIDESTTIKTPTSNRTKNILSLRPNSKYRRILTGSPVTKSPLDLFSQCLFLDPWLLDHQSYYTFRARYSICKKIQVNGRQVEIVVGYRNLGELSEKIKPFSKRILKEDCLDLPSKSYVKHYVELTKEQKKVYEQMKKEAIAFLDDKMQSSATVMTQLMRLHQITCGHFTADDGTIKDIPCSRLTELMNILEKVDPEKALGFYLYDLRQGQSEATKLFTGGKFGVLSGEPKTPKDVIERYFIANKALFGVRKDAQTHLLNAMKLGVNPNKLEEIFEKRGIPKRLLDDLLSGEFKPFFPSEKIQQRFEDIAFEGGQPNPFLGAEGTLEAMKNILEIQNLYGDFNLELSDFLPDTDPTGGAALPPTDMPSNTVIQTSQAPMNMIQGLTPVENALYSEEEKQITLRNRGFA